jgi:hypothetical protein
LTTGLYFKGEKISAGILKIIPLEPGVVGHTCNPSIQEAKEGGLRLQGQPGSRARPCVKKLLHQSGN